MIGESVTHYKILSKLGEGGMGVVYKAQDLKLDRLAALKFLPLEFTRDPEARDRFIHEAKAASSLQHSNICVIYEVDETDDGHLFISMEYLESETLESTIARGPLTINQALDIAIQVAQGMAEAHCHGIVHRDLKPANVLLTNRGEAKIVDFGVAKFARAGNLTRQGMTVGTVAYMSPEQARGDHVDERTDIWSLGVLLYEMLTGRRPFIGEYEHAVSYSIANVDPEPLTALRGGISPDLERIIRKCLAKHPGARYQRMEALRADLLSCAGATSPGSAEAPSRSILLPGRKKLVLLGGAGLIALTLIAAVLFTHVNPSSPRPKKIAVLPFENLGPAEDEYFADGLTDEIASRLSSIHGLGVISRTSSTQYKKTTKPLPVVGKELGVDYILEGAIRWEKIGGRERIRITPRLIQISGDVNLWADNFDRTLDDIFAIQTEIATMVVRSLDIVLGESENRAINAVPTKNLEAYQSYLRGLWFSARFERPNVEMAIDMLTRAVELDSTFARAYAELSIAHMYEYWYGFDRTNVRLARARGYLDRAFALQPDLPEANLALGYYHLYGSRDYTQALEAFAAAERSLPNSSRAIEADGYVWRRQGKFEAAAERLKQAFELDPQNGGLLMEIGNTFRMLGRYAEAQEYLDRSISLLPDQSIAYIWKARIDLTWHGDTSMSRTDLDRVPRAYTPVRDLVWLDLYERRYQSALDRLSRLPGPLLDDQIAFLPISMVRGLILEFMKDTARAEASFDTARVYLESQAEERPEDGRIHQSLGIVYAGLGRREAAIHEARLAVEELPLTRDAWWGVFPVITLAQVYTMTGRYDAAIDQLESLLSGVASREITPPILLLDPNYDPLRNNPRFQSLLTKYASP